MYHNIACLTPPTTHPIDEDQQAVLDSGCSTHTLRDDTPSDERQPNPVTKLCGTPTGTTMSANDQALLPFNALPIEAREANHYPDLKYKSLLSAGQFCNSGYRT